MTENACVPASKPSFCRQERSPARGAELDGPWLVRLSVRHLRRGHRLATAVTSTRTGCQSIKKMAPVLPDGWEAVAAEDGRTYYWNVNTNETVWEAPTTAHSPIAASFLSMAAASSESGRQAAAGILNTSSGSSEGGSTPTSESGRSKALGVDAMRKYREAKEAEAKASPQSRPGERPSPPPKVDLYK